MAALPTIEVHRHREATRVLPDITTITSFSYSATANGSEGFNFTFKAPVSDHPTRVRVGDWVVLRDGNLTVRAWGHVDSVTGGYAARENGPIVTMPVTVSASSWLDMLQKCKLYVPKGDTQTLGTMMFLFDWQAIWLEVLNTEYSGSIGAALTVLHRKVARVKLPESLGGEFLGDAVPVVHNQQTQARWAPRRAIDPVASCNAGGVTQLRGDFFESSVRELYFSSFVPDSHLIELFPSLEDMGDGNYDAPTTSDVPSDSALSRALGRRPVLIYRLRPFRTRALKDAAITFSNWNLNDDPDARLRAAAASLDPLRIATEAVGATKARAAHEANNAAAQRQLGVLQKIFTEVTWDTSDPNRVVEVPPRMVRKVVMNWSDDRRVNCTSINISADANNGLEAHHALALPITQPQSLVEHGCRVTKPNWPFVFSRNHGDWYSYMRSVAAQLMQFEQNAHAMAQGTISLDYGDAVSVVEDPVKGQTVFSPQRPLPVGEILLLTAPATEHFYCYINAVSHEYTVRPNGADTASSTVQYTRGLYGMEGARDADVPLKPSAPAAVQPNGQGPGGTGKRGRPSNKNGTRTRAVIGIMFDGQFIPWSGSQRVDYWPYTKQMSARDERTPAQVTQAVLHYTDGADTSKTASGTYGWFNSGKAGVGGQTDTHFIIEASGVIVQCLDLKYNANHAIGMNSRSIGIDFVCPRFRNLTSFDPNLGWQLGTGYSFGSLYSDYVFYRPTPQQLAAGRALVRWANTYLGVALTAPLYSGSATSISYSGPNAASGVYHHAEVNTSRVDCIGVSIPRDIL